MAFLGLHTDCLMEFAMDAKNWSKEQIEKLKEYQGNGLPPIDGKSKNAIYRKMKSLGLQINLKQPHWTDQELDLIRSCDGSYTPVIEGRTKRAIRHKMNLMGIYDRSRPAVWSKEEIYALRQHSLNKKSGLLGRSKDAILKKIQDLGLEFFKSNVCGKYLAWTDDELLKVKLISQGHNITIENRSKTSIQRKIRELGLKQNRLYEQWTEEEIKLLKNKKPIPGRSRKSVNRKRIGLRLFKRKPRKSWTLENERKLKKFVKEGHSALQIFKMGVLPKKYTRVSIQKKICRLNLSKKTIIKYKKFSSDIVRISFEKFLKDNWKNNLPKELSNQWNRLNPKEQVSHRRVIRYLSKLNIKVSSYEMRRIKTQKEKEKNIIDVAHQFKNVKNLNETIRLNRVELMRKRFEQKKDIWDGRDLDPCEYEDLSQI